MSSSQQQIVRQAKRQLRKTIKAKLASLIAEQVQSQFTLVRNHPKYQSARSVSIFIGTATEVNTDALVRDALTSKVDCFVPRCDGSVMQMVKLHSIEDYEMLPANRWGIKEPPLEEFRPDCFEAGRLDLVVVPGLAFDREGNRCGYGKGYYDAFYQRCRERFGINMPYFLAVALNEQIVEAVPHDALDQRPDEIVTPGGSIWCGQRTNAAAL
ncbi:hypothetical protein EV182_000040 [Spiromyces aspiralis]|uniref:Uncharacterized protein n=1 Tax=Spiromyces aspiralis TaxID=68401 RepID=A0ACC1HL91_9FUNG|nr:hypothetical protein EV182_000040 [Spiromyces aspiralis]